MRLRLRQFFGIEAVESSLLLRLSHTQLGRSSLLKLYQILLQAAGLIGQFELILDQLADFVLESNDLLFVLFAQRFVILFFALVIPEFQILFFELCNFFLLLFDD